MVRENVTWGEERIADELSLKLGIHVSPRAIRKYWPQQPGIRSGRRRSASQHWKTFVRNHAQGIVACDFLGAVTARFPRRCRALWLPKVRTGACEWKANCWRIRS